MFGTIIMVILFLVFGIWKFIFALLISLLLFLGKYILIAFGIYLIVSIIAGIGRTG